MAQICDWIHSQHEVLLCMDVNDSTNDTNPNTGISYILSHMNLIDLHQYRHPMTNTPPTHNHRQLTIDTCLGTKFFAHALISAWYLPFRFPVTMPGDHHALGIDFDINMLFGNKIPEAALTQTQGVYSNDMPTICKFNNMVADEVCQEAQLFTTVNELYCKYQFTTADHHTLEQVDQTLTSILTAADHKCNQKYTYLWSPALHCAYLVHHYWTLKFSKLHTNRDFRAALAQIQEQLPFDPENNLTISANLCHTCNQLRELRYHAPCSPKMSRIPHIIG